MNLTNSNFTLLHGGLKRKDRRIFCWHPNIENSCDLVFMVDGLGGGSRNFQHFLGKKRIQFEDHIFSKWVVKNPPPTCESWTTEVSLLALAF